MKTKTGNAEVHTTTVLKYCGLWHSAVANVLEELFFPSSRLTIYKTTWHHKSEDHKPLFHHPENLISYNNPIRHCFFAHGISIIVVSNKYINITKEMKFLGYISGLCRDKAFMSAILARLTL
jgi:hypothetical protein